jgi:succinylglutamate desuccinylase
MSTQAAATSQEIEAEIARFETFPDSVARQGSAGRFTVKALAPFAYALTPAGGPRHVPKGKRFALTLIGLTHGNELAGGGVINGFLALLAAGVVPLDVEIAVILGNPWAARQNKRFLERDLNRSFASPLPAGRPGTLEGDRARALEPILADTALLVDFHQVTRDVDRSFFIFPYRPESYAFARAIAPWQTVVTHWGAGFSVEGKCTDEFVNASGGTGISLELGQNGLERKQVATGVEAALWALAYAAQRFAGGESGAFELARQRAQTFAPELYTWAEVVPWPAKGVVTLEPGWDNFAEVKAGQRLGTVDGVALAALKAGRMLFPKYLTPEQQAALTSRPTELCRIMRRITEAELPTKPLTPFTA